ncbi:MAG: flippase-like domain-containing protein [Flavobacteriales bacterium]|nr:flippase-like domain-containing protein [Flavobacteriales bacterium]MCB9195778.1 flippase-like domain-containing protein [Flavobacteriales bacterium]
MKKILLTILKIGLPVLLGVYISWYFWTSFDETQKEEFIDVFSRANYFWVFLALAIGFMSHLSRAIRWKYALKPMGYEPSTFSTYNAVMIGYIANILVPRMGEASRAGVLRATDDVPFDKSFGSIVAERVIDVICLGIISGGALLFNLDKIDDLIGLKSVINQAKEEESVSQTPWLLYSIGGIFILGIIGGLFIWFKVPSLKEKIVGFLKGLKEGLISIFKMEDRIPYLLHTLNIWVCYVAMFWVVFYALPFTAELSVQAIMAGFVAGTIGFIIVQGGIGTYPLMVGAIVTFFRAPEVIAAGEIQGEDVGFGALVWASQTVLIVVLGLISLILVQRKKKKLKAVA